MCVASRISVACVVLSHSLNVISSRLPRSYTRYEVESSACNAFSHVRPKLPLDANLERSNISFPEYSFTRKSYAAEQDEDMRTALTRSFTRSPMWACGIAAIVRRRI